MKLYHYTKGISIHSIFTDGFIGTERKRGLSVAKFLTDCVWLTERTAFPKTALPFIDGLPETNLANHLDKRIFLNLDKIRIATGGIFRFSFDSTDHHFKKWHFSDERKAIINDLFLRRMESIANKVGDDVRSFWISSFDIPLSHFTLESYENGCWLTLLTCASMESLSDEESILINGLTTNSRIECMSYGLPFHHVRMVA